MTAPAPWAVQGADRTRQPSSAMSVIPDWLLVISLSPKENAVVQCYHVLCVLVVHT